MQIINIKDCPAIGNMGAMPRGTGAKYLECSTHDSDQGRDYIAMRWRRKLPVGIPPWHVIIDFNTSAIGREIKE